MLAGRWAGGRLRSSYFFPAACLVTASRRIGRCSSTAHNPLRPSTQTQTDWFSQLQQQHATRDANALQVIDCHAAGEPARVVVGGLPHIEGDTLYEKRRVFMEQHDNLRKLLITEPRGYPCQNVDFVVPATTPGALFGYIIGEQKGIYPLMSGHNTLCVVRALVEAGAVPLPTAYQRRGTGIMPGFSLNGDTNAAADADTTVTPTSSSFVLDAPAGPIEVRLDLVGPYDCGPDGKPTPDASTNPDANPGANPAADPDANPDASLDANPDASHDASHDAAKPDANPDSTPSKLAASVWGRHCRPRHQELLITLRNQPSFVSRDKVTVEVPALGLGGVEASIVYGGMFYVVVNAADVGLSLQPRHGRDIVRLGEAIKVAAREQHPVNHPDIGIDYPGPDILVFREPLGNAQPGSQPRHWRNAVVMSNTALSWDEPSTWTGMLDRSPCGTGTCAVMALMHARGQLQLGEPFVHESIVGTTFVGRLVAATTLAHGQPAVVPEITGAAHVTQMATVITEPTDPFPTGYTVGDIWGG
eukprot:m.155662 g.155662  ORF g.155662 m.155662 type:complete len:531 (+) comp17538_c0_seq3:49-1641(+)